MSEPASSTSSAADAVDPDDLVNSIHSHHDLQTRIPELIGRVQNFEVSNDIKEQVIQYLRSATTSQSKDCPRICVLGKTGSGKTSLVNAILGVDLLPAVPEGEDEGRAVTSAVTEICHDPELPKGRFLITPVMATSEEWTRIKGILTDSLHGRFEGESLDTAELNSLATSVFTDVFPDTQPHQVDETTSESQEFSSRYLSDGHPVRPQVFDNLEEVTRFLSSRVHLSLAASKTEALLTQCVRVAGCFPLIPQDVTLVDLPGLEDTNILRSSVAERYFSLHCTHAWFCLPKPEVRILSDASLQRQIRVLARGGRLGNLLFVRTKGDMGRKRTSTLEKEFEHFKTLCYQAQDGLSMTEVPAQYITVTTAPADEEQEALVDIGGVKDIMQAIAQRQQISAREVAQVALRKVEGMLHDSIDTTAAQVKTKLTEWQSEVEVFRQSVLNVDPSEARNQLMDELDCAGTFHFNTLKALINRHYTGFCYKSRGQSRSYDLRSTTIRALRLRSAEGVDRLLEDCWSRLFDSLKLSMDGVPALPLDFLNTINAKANIVRQQINADLTVSGLVSNDLRETLVHPFPSGTGATAKFIEQSRIRVQGDEGAGIPKLLKDLDESLGGAARRLSEDLYALAEDRFPERKRVFKRLRRLGVDPKSCCICKEALAVTRAEYVQCRCNPRTPYACHACARMIDTQYCRCPVCRVEG